MKTNGFVKVWNVIYPILIYYVISNVVIYLAMLFLGVGEETYVQNYMLLQTISTAVALPVLYSFYRKDQLFMTVFYQRTSSELAELQRKSKILNGVLTFACGALAGLTLNNIIGATGLTELSQGYQNVTAHFYGGGLVFEILGAGILIPLVEELLYRGIVYGRLSDWLGIPGAALVSALIFGALHMNLVQFIYAFFMGLMMVYFLEKTHNLYGAALGHMGANLLTVLRTETGAFRWMESSPAAFWGVTVGMVVVCAILVLVLRGKKDEKRLKS